MTRLPEMRADVVVVGGGPAGIAAATRAAEAGSRVVIIDSGMRPGGQIWRHTEATTLPRAARRWIERSRHRGVTWLLRSTVVDGGVARGLTVVSHEGTRVVRAPSVVVATGSRELFLPFPGWTLPNAMGVGGAQALLKGGLEVRGKRVIVAGSGPLLLPAAAALAEAGADVRHVVEQAPMNTLVRFAASLLPHPAKLAQAARYRAAIPLRAYQAGVWVARADGDGRVQSVTLTNGPRRWTEPCDLLCCSYGLIPSTELARLLGCTVTDGRVVVDGWQRTTSPGVFCAGESTGVAGDDAATAEGEVAGLAAAAGGEVRLPPRLVRRRDRGRRFQRALSDVFRPRPELLHLAEHDTVVCRCEDVRLGRLERTWTGRQAKLYTRAGMGPCQGAVCGPAMQHLFGWAPGSVRPPLFAPSLDAWASVEEQPGVTGNESVDVRPS